MSNIFKRIKSGNHSSVTAGSASTSASRAPTGKHSAASKAEAASKGNGAWFALSEAAQHLVDSQRGAAQDDVSLKGLSNFMVAEKRFLSAYSTAFSSRAAGSTDESERCMSLGSKAGVPATTLAQFILEFDVTEMPNFSVMTSTAHNNDAYRKIRSALVDSTGEGRIDIGFQTPDPDRREWGSGQSSSAGR